MFEKYAPFVFTVGVLSGILILFLIMSRMESVYFTGVINELRRQKSFEDGTPYEPIEWYASGDITDDVIWWHKAIGCK